MRKISLGISWGALLLLSLASVGCSQCHHPRELISINMRDDPHSLDPREVRLLSNINLIKHIYEGLVQENTSTGEIEPALAEHYSVSDDGKKYTFHLRQAYWSNGDPLIAEDFIDSWKQVVTHEVGGIYHFAFDPIKNAKKVAQQSCLLNDIGFYAKDEKTIVVELDSPTSHFLKLLSLPIFFPVHEKQRQGITSIPITNGAFYLKKIKAKQWIRLEKNPHYYNHKQVNTQAIVVHFIPDANTAALLFNQGKLHWQGPPWGERIPTEALAHLKSKGRLHTFEVAGTSWITFNIHKFPFNSSKLRKALALALDKNSLVSAAFLDRVQPAHHLLPTSIHKSPISHFSPNPEEKNRCLAKKLFLESLEELGICSKDLENHTLAFPATSASHARLVQLIREQWKEVLGFTISIVGKEFSLLQKELTSGQFSLATGEWFADFSDPMAFLSLFDYPSGVAPYSINHKDFLSLLETIQKEQEAQKRSELVSQAVLYLESLHIIEPIYHDAFHVALNKKFSNLGFSPTGIVDFRYIDST
ncbi:peptide ABC transporter substrate-binding protein [Chlamydia avium]|uniref:Oligopeptide-binding protein OppA n=1 Tax=Chlamydia avium 10DC88 TaxID=1229831 RepID=W8JQV5_9CHLA|nr:peptide ABC transporter substrate-binding protein [Chlamydia avium]AHK63218.1 Oligopeptide-binding protein OppA [Chlamydia avium 10DC88]